MPHFTIEYSTNLDDRVDIAAVVELVRAAAAETGLFALDGICVRAVRCANYAIADGRDGLSFMAMLLRVNEGRDAVARKHAGDHIFGRLSRYLEPLFADDRFALSFDIKVHDREAGWERNSIHDLLINEARHG